jgi:hypothetical protein
VSARREPPGVLVVIRCGWGNCRYKLGEVWPIKPRIEGDPAGMAVTAVKSGSRRHIESIVPADFSGHLVLGLCPHDAERHKRVKRPGGTG